MDNIPFLFDDALEMELISDEQYDELHHELNDIIPNLKRIFRRCFVRSNMI